MILKAPANVKKKKKWNGHGKKRRKTALAGLRKEYHRFFQEYPMDILFSGKLAPLFFLFSTDIPRNILMLASTLRVLANLGIFPRIITGIPMENGASWFER